MKVVSRHKFIALDTHLSFSNAVIESEPKHPDYSVRIFPNLYLPPPFYASPCCCFRTGSHLVYLSSDKDTKPLCPDRQEHFVTLCIVQNALMPPKIDDTGGARMYSMMFTVLHSPVTSSLFGPNILLSTLFSNTRSLCSSLTVRDQVSHPYFILYNINSVRTSQEAKYITDV
jgi:hypothetical protein